MADMVINYMDLHEINITPNAATQSFARLAKGLSDAEPSTNENVDQTPYLDGDGFGTSSVIGAQKTISFSGHRYVGDPAQDFIASLEYNLGNNRETSYRYTDADGTKLTGACTIANIEIGGGGAGDKKAIAFEVHINGRPIQTPKAIAEELTAVVSAGTTVGTTTFTATAGGDNELAYRLLPQSAGTVYEGQYIDGYVLYESGDEIEASAGQFLQMIELDANMRVAKYAEHELIATDIAS